MPDNENPSNSSEQAAGKKAQTGMQLGAHTATYILGSGIAMLNGVVMLPVYTHALTPRDYGILETTLRFVSICMNVAFMGLRQGYLRFYFDRDDSRWHKTLTSTAILGVPLVALGIMFPILVVAAHWFADRIGLEKIGLWTALMLSVWLTFEAIYLLGLSYLQVRFKSKQFILAQGSRLLMMLCVNVVLLNVFHLGLNGALLGNLAVSMASGGVFAALLLSWSGIKTSGPTLRELVKFGLPYIPTAFFSYVINNADRLALIHFGLLSVLGLLSLASKLGDMALSVLASPVENIWVPFAFSVKDSVDGAARIGRLFTRYMAFVVLIALTVSLAAPLALGILASHSYEGAARLVPIVAAGCVFGNLACLADLGILVKKRTQLKPVIMAVAGAIAVGLQALLIPRFGIVGAVIGTAATNVFLYLIVSTIAGRFYRFTINRAHVVWVAASALIVVLAGFWIESQFPSLWVSAICTAIGIVAYMAVIHWAHIMTFSEIRAHIGNLLARVGIGSRD